MCLTNFGVIYCFDLRDPGKVVFLEIACSLEVDGDTPFLVMEMSELVCYDDDEERLLGC